MSKCEVSPISGFTMMWYAFLLLLTVIQSSTGDINLHNLRGCNNRLDESKRNVANKNRLFDSQNNNAGGVNVGGKMKFIAGSKLKLEWTNQHSCNDQNNNCEIIIQYMCGQNVRDGSTTKTAPPTDRRCKRKNCDTDQRFGMHESYQYYRECRSRKRNIHLYTAGNIRKRSALFTRQNKRGKKYGYECPEERDYYPYWNPTPWKDIAILTTNLTRCEYYRQRSQNNNPKFHCKLPDGYWKLARKDKDVLPITQEECESSNIVMRGKRFRGQWIAEPSHGLDSPDCLQAPFTRDNHNGNTIGGHMPYYDWTVPNDVSNNCVLRIRYNVSTSDFDSWTERAEHPSTKSPTAIWQTFNMTKEEAITRGYILKNDPVVDIFNTGYLKRKAFRLQLAINTAQYGRTFEDRSHVFAIVERPPELRGQKIYNVNVRGKRGNIVQVYPSVEYDYVPNRLLATEGDYVQFQWTGSDTNPRQNDGQGTKGTDRHNIVQLVQRSFIRSRTNSTLTTNYPTLQYPFLGLNMEMKMALSQLDYEGNEVGSLLNEATVHFDIGPQRLTESGVYHYMCTRNNNFSNRNQKATIEIGNNCYKRVDRGFSYRGYISTTRSGKTCLPWGGSSTRLQRSGLSENYCRNFVANMASPWCYVKIGRRKTKETCGISQC